MLENVKDFGNYLYRDKLILGLASFKFNCVLSLTKEVLVSLHKNRCVLTAEEEVFLP